MCYPPEVTKSPMMHVSASIIIGRAWAATS
jgi:hypothetical protein